MRSFNNKNETSHKRIKLTKLQHDALKYLQYGYEDVYHQEIGRLLRSIKTIRNQRKNGRTKWLDSMLAHFLGVIEFMQGEYLDYKSNPNKEYYYNAPSN